MFNKKKTSQDLQQNKLSLDPETMVFLGLQKQPFNAIILSENEIYSNTVLDQLLETTRHHLQFSDLTLIIEGELGSGKTTLFRNLIQNDIPNLKLLPVLAETTDTLVQIQQKISIHLQDQGNANYLDDNLKRLGMFEQTPVLIIDDAHVLSDTTLQELIRYIGVLKSTKDTQLKLLLLANKGMAETLEQISDLQHNQLFVQQIPALTPKQAMDFIQHKLSHANYKGDVLFDDKTIDKLLKKFGNLPEQILKGASHHLNKMTPGKRKLISLSFGQAPKPVILFATLSLIVAVVIAAYFYLDVNAPVVTQLPEQPIIPTKPAVPDSDTQPLLTEPVIEQARPETDIDVTAIEAPEEKEVILDNTEVLPTEAITEEHIEIPPSSELAANETAPVATETPLAKEQAETTLPLETAKPVAPLPVPQPVTPPRPAQPPAPPPVKKLPPSNSALQQLAALGIHDSAWLIKQDKHHWTLQILGARDPQTLLKFAKSNHLGDDTAWYETRLNNKPWYILVHRLYSDKDIARQSIASLPANLQKSRPWVKSMADVHKAIQP